MVTVAQLVEPRVVILVVVGSSPISHPIIFQSKTGPLAQLVEQGTLNPKVVGSTPTRPTIQDNNGLFRGNHTKHHLNLALIFRL